MLDYFWQHWYVCIMMRWCIGYLEDAELIVFLKEAKAHLYEHGDLESRNYEPGAFIIVLDQVAPPALTIDAGKKMVIRNQLDIEELFADAGLTIYKSTRMRKLYEGYEPVKIWALC